MRESIHHSGCLLRWHVQQCGKGAWNYYCICQVSDLALRYSQVMLRIVLSVSSIIDLGRGADSR